MRIFFLASSFPDDSDQRRGIFNYRFIKQMVETKEEISVFFFRFWYPGRKVKTKYNYRGIEVEQVCVPLIPIDNYFVRQINNLSMTLFGAWVLKNEIIAADIIHSVSLSSNGIIAGRWAARFNKYHVAQAIGSDVNADMKILVKKRPFHSWIKRVDGIIANSKDLEVTIKNLYPNCPVIKTIYRGIEVNELEEVSSSNIKRTTFLYLGGLNHHSRSEYGMNTKGGITLMRTWKKIENDPAFSHAILYFGGPNSDVETFSNWRESLLYPNRVYLIGKLTPAQVKEYIRKSDLVIIPSMAEGMPNLLLEGNANGIPVIGSDAGGIPEVIIHGKTGYIFEKGNEESLGEVLIKASQNYKENIQMGRNAYNRAKIFFNSNFYSRKVIDFYDEIIKSSSKI